MTAASLGNGHWNWRIYPDCRGKSVALWDREEETSAVAIGPVTQDP